MELYTLLFVGGLALMGGTVIAGVISIAVLTVSGKRLRVRLEKEYGPRRRRK